MIAEDRPLFAELMLGLGETYGEPVSDARMEIYFSALADLELADIRAAATIHVKTQKFFPRPSELLEAVDGDTSDRAEVAWVTMRQLVRRYGYWGIDGHSKPPQFPDEATRRAAMDLYGGWKALCERLPGEGPELLGVAKNFKALYQAYARADRRLEELPAPSKQEARGVLSGLSGLKNELNARGLPSGGL